MNSSFLMKPNRNLPLSAWDKPVAALNNDDFWYYWSAVLNDDDGDDDVVVRMLKMMLSLSHETPFITCTSRLSAALNRFSLTSLRHVLGQILTNNKMGANDYPANIPILWSILLC